MINIIIFVGKFPVKVKKAIEYDIQQKEITEDIFVFNDPTDQVLGYFFTADALFSIATPLNTISKHSQLVKPDLATWEAMKLTNEVVQAAFFSSQSSNVFTKFMKTGLEVKEYHFLGLALPENLIIVEDVELAISKHDLEEDGTESRSYWYVDENLLPGIMSKSEFADINGYKRTTLNNKIVEGSDLFYKLEGYLVKEKPKGKCKYQIDTTELLKDYSSIEEFLSLNGFKSTVFKPMTRTNGSFELVKKYLIRVKV